jgi:predicted permease
MTAALGGEYPQNVEGILVSCNYFDVLQVPPRMGTGFTDINCGDPDADPVVVLSHDLWMRVMNADPDVVGKKITLNRKQFAVVGIAPEGFHGADARKSSFFVPITLQQVIRPGRDDYGNDHLSWLSLIGRMKDDAEIDQVRADLGLIASQIDQQQPGRETNLQIAKAANFSLPEGRRTIFSVATVIMAAFGLVLLIACANVANLLLARSTARRREIAVRLSLGATRARLVQQLLTESLLIALAGGILGSLLALWSFRGLMALALSSMPGQLPPFVLDVSPDLSVLWFAVGISFGTGIIFGLAPALQTTKTDLQSALKQDTAGSGHRTTGLLRCGLVGIQAAVCMILMILAGLLLRGLYATQTVDPGFAYEGVTVIALDLMRGGYDEARAAVLQHQFIDRARPLSATGTIARAGRTPLSPGRTGTVVRLPGQEQPYEMDFNTVSPEYFSLIQLPIVRGRNFTDADLQDNSRGIIVTESTAIRYWPDREPIGQSLSMRIGGPKGRDFALEVVGVAKDAQIRSIGETPASYMYLPAAPRAGSRAELLLRSRTDFATTVSSIRAIARELDPGIVVRVNRLEENLSYWRTVSLFATSLSASLGALALLIASIGVYGVVSYVVSRRLREVGIRMVLGASGREVQRMIVTQTLRPVVIGMFIGIAAAAAVSRFLEAVLFGISAFDPVAFVAAPLFLLAVAASASLGPARKALRVDLTATLRYE